jgi:glycosyltransferase involved in cell wall biosynthesis
MKYSIILPVHNGGQYVKECIGSILAQTLQDFNIIVLENKSTDGTAEWLASLQNEKIIIIPTLKPLSIEENWSRIKDVPKNEFITLIGHDDILYPSFLEHIDKLIQAHPTAGLYHAHFHFIDATGKVIRNSKPMPAFLSFNNLLKGFLTQSVDSMGTGYVMRAADYDALGGIPVKYPNLLFADFELWLSLAKNGMAIAEQSCFAFRVHQSTTGSSQDVKLHTGLELYVDFLVKQKKVSKETEEIIKKYSSETLLLYCKGFCHRLLRTQQSLRNGITVNSFIEQTKLLAEKLGVKENYFPERLITIKIAALIDKHKFLRSLFLWIKKVYPKPIT